jgi:hypothetical protein
MRSDLRGVFYVFGVVIPLIFNKLTENSEISINFDIKTRSKLIFLLDLTSFCINIESKSET